MAAAEPQPLHRAPGCLQQPFQFHAGREGHHRILLPMGEQEFCGRGLIRLQREGQGLPARMGVATAGNQGRQRQRPPGWPAVIRLRSNPAVTGGPTSISVLAATPGGHIQGHGGPLGEAQQGRALQRHTGAQRDQPSPELHPGRGQLGPLRLLQVVPLAADAAGMGQGRPQGHQADLGLLSGGQASERQQLQPQVEQVIGIGSPAMQQHQPAAGPLRSELDGRAVIPGGLIVERGGHAAGAAAAA